MSLQELFLLGIRRACILQTKYNQHKDDTELWYGNSGIPIPTVLLHMVNNDTRSIRHHDTGHEYSHVGKAG
jgi:hypothetical protein